jgi:sarcosine oxidase
VTWIHHVPGSLLTGDSIGSSARSNLPNNPRVIIASPCSGHGFKFASAIGEMLCAMALRKAPCVPAFALNRFKPFA